jgi:hypothetical protein
MSDQIVEPQPDPLAAVAADAAPEPQLVEAPVVAAPDAVTEPAAPALDVPAQPDTAPAETADIPAPGSPRFLIVVPVGAVVTKPDYVDVVELRDGAPQNPIIHHFWG